LCAELGVDAVHVLAHDYGVSVAQELLARRERGRTSSAARLGLRSVCFLNGGLFPETHHARPIQKLLLTPLGPLVTLLWRQRAFNRSLAAVFGPATQPTPDELQHYWSLVTAGNGRRLLPALIRYIPERRLNRERWLAAMQSTDVPLRLVDGPLDPVSGAHMAARYRELVPDPDVVLLPGIGHYPQMEDPVGVLEAYLAFLDRFRSA
jgi:pimeloyl-ACP methyl ester carboxylesterase